MSQGGEPNLLIRKEAEVPCLFLLPSLGVKHVCWSKVVKVPHQSVTEDKKRNSIQSYKVNLQPKKSLPMLGLLYAV